MEVAMNVLAAVWSFLVGACTVTAIGFIVWTIASYLEERRYERERQSGVPAPASSRRIQ
jgi:NADH:ubiquinone oxidoreductase subunit 3 (subunit A)